MRTPASPITVLYSHTSSLVGGGNVVLLRLLAKLDRLRFRPRSVIPSHGPLESRLRDLDVPYEILNLQPAPSRIRDAVTIARLLMLKRRLRPDIIHSNDPYTYRLLSWLTTRERRLCHIHHPAIDRPTIKWTFQRTPAAVAVPTNLVANLVRHEIETLPLHRRPSVHVVGNPIDTDWFSPVSDVKALKARLGIDPEEPHISLMASMSEHKGQRCFLRMARRICDRMPNVTFSIVGGITTGTQAYVDSLKSLAATLGLSERVRFWGFVDDETARDIIASSDLFVLPSKEEGFGLVLAEAQACGVPVLTSSIPPLPEVVLDGRTGYLFDSDDHEAFAARALQMLESGRARVEVGRAGREFVVERFSAHAFARQLTAMYERIAAQPA